MKKIKTKNITSFNDHLDTKYGKKGSDTREKFEQEFDAFKIGVLIKEARSKKHLTQEELAQKAGTTKNYISRIENGASDIRLTTLMRVIKDGLGGSLKLTMDL
jgi:DNA-binding XRE family transcriptional regulator